MGLKISICSHHHRTQAPLEVHTGSDTLLLTGSGLLVSYCCYSASMRNVDFFARVMQKIKTLSSKLKISI